MNENKQSTSKITIVTIVTLVLIFPIGLLLMWFKTRWTKPVKWIITGIFALLLFGNTFVFNHASSLPVNQPTITKAPITATPTPTKTLTPSPTFTPLPTRKPIYATPTTLPISNTPTAIPTAPIATSQQVEQTNNGATALCNDGTYSFAAHDQGACSHHQGVKEFYK